MKNTKQELKLLDFNTPNKLMTKPFTQAHILKDPLKITLFSH